MKLVRLISVAVQFLKRLDILVTFSVLKPDKSRFSLIWQPSNIHSILVSLDVRSPVKSIWDILAFMNIASISVTSEQSRPDKLTEGI